MGKSKLAPKEVKSKEAVKTKTEKPEPRMKPHKKAKKVIVESAESLAKKQREISVSEFFAKNRHLLGFDNPKKALLTAVKEAVDNSLDACEEARISPDIIVKLVRTSPKPVAPPPPSTPEEEAAARHRYCDGCRAAGVVHARVLGIAHAHHQHLPGRQQRHRRSPAERDRDHGLDPIRSARPAHNEKAPPDGQGLGNTSCGVQRSMTIRPVKTWPAASTL